MADACHHCDAELVTDDDFCHACGHSLDYGGDDSTLSRLEREDRNSGDVCPRCGATHMVMTEAGGHLCETCGFLA